jgi:hypothetical protein
LNNLGSFLVLGLGAGGWCACKSKTDSARPAQPAPSTSVAIGSAASVVPPASGAAAVRRGLAEDEVRRFVARWEAAQNERDFYFLIIFRANKIRRFFRFFVAHKGIIFYHKILRIRKLTLDLFEM